MSILEPLVRDRVERVRRCLAVGRALGPAAATKALNARDNSSRVVEVGAGLTVAQLMSRHHKETKTRRTRELPGRKEPAL